MTPERLRELIAYDPDTGSFVWNVSGNGRTKGALAGAITRTNGHEYLYLNLDGKAYLAHRIAFLYQTGKWPEHVVDHDDNNGLNNAWSNLSDVMHARNLQKDNRAPKAKSGVRGVYWSEAAGKWYAAYMKNGIKHYLGLFHSVRKAEEALVKHKIS